MATPLELRIPTPDSASSAPNTARNGVSVHLPPASETPMHIGDKDLVVLARRATGFTFDRPSEEILKGKSYVPLLQYTGGELPLMSPDDRAELLRLLKEAVQTKKRTQEPFSCCTRTALAVTIVVFATLAFVFSYDIIPGMSEEIAYLRNFSIAGSLLTFAYRYFKEKRVEQAQKDLDALNIKIARQLDAYENVLRSAGEDLENDYADATPFVASASKVSQRELTQLFNPQQFADMDLIKRNIQELAEVWCRKDISNSVVDALKKFVPTDFYTATGTETSHRLERVVLFFDDVVDYIAHFSGDIKELKRGSRNQCLVIMPGVRQGKEAALLRRLDEIVKSNAELIVALGGEPERSRPTSSLGERKGEESGALTPLGAHSRSNSLSGFFSGQLQVESRAASPSPARTPVHQRPDSARGGHHSRKGSSLVPITEADKEGTKQRTLLRKRSTMEDPAQMAVVAQVLKRSEFFKSEGGAAADAAPSASGEPVRRGSHESVGKKFDPLEARADGDVVQLTQIVVERAPNFDAPD